MVNWLIGWSNPSLDSEANIDLKGWEYFQHWGLIGYHYKIDSGKTLLVNCQKYIIKQFLPSFFLKFMAQLIWISFSWISYNFNVIKYLVSLYVAENEEVDSTLDSQKQYDLYSIHVLVWLIRISTAYGMIHQVKKKFKQIPQPQT